jgi:site-specific recombinase XerD
VPGTVSWYDNILRDLTAFLVSGGIQEIAAIEPAHLRDYLSCLRERGQASHTVCRTYGALRCVFRFLIREGCLSKDPMEPIERPRKERNLIKPLSIEQVALLIGQPDKKTVEGLRDRAIIMLILDSGLRVSEAVSLELDRIDWANCTLTVMGKGRKERAVPFSATTCEALLAYSRLRRELGVGSPKFFVGRTGNGLERTKIRRIILRHGARARITGVRMSPHTLRHTFAFFYIRNGGDAFSLQEILGHNTLEMARIYVNLARRDVAEQHKKYSPMQVLFGAAGRRRRRSSEADFKGSA